MGGTQGAATDNQNSRGQQPPLPFFANSTEQDLSAIALVHCLSV
jgi:hypothetical protein